MAQGTDRFGAMQGKAVLVTGGAGFIGSHLCDRLVTLGARVRVLDDLSTGARSNVPPGATLIVDTILNHEALRRSIAGCELVFHQAAMVSVPQSVEQPQECMRQNVLGTERVLSAAVEAGVRRVMFAASAAAYGDAGPKACREDQLPAPASPYGMSKVAGELLLSVFSRNYQLSSVSLRYMNIYGARQNPKGPYAAAIGAFHESLRDGRRPTIFGDGRQTRDWTHVDDVVQANLLAAIADRPLAGEVVNVGTGVRTDLLGVLKELAGAMGVQVEPVFAPIRAGDVKDVVADITKARSILGYQPMVNLREGFKRMITA